MKMIETKPIKLAINPEDLFDLNESNVDIFIKTVKDFFIRREVYCSYSLDSNGLFRQDIDIENPKLFLGIDKIGERCKILESKVGGVLLQSSLLGDARNLKGLYYSDEINTQLIFSQLPKVAFIDDDKLYLSIGDGFYGPFRKRKGSLYQIITG